MRGAGTRHASSPAGHLRAGESLSPLWRYGLAITLTVAAALLKLALNSTGIGRSTPFLVFFTAILASSWYGGLGPGLLTTALTALAADIFFLPPYGRVSISPTEAFQLGVFLLEGGLVSWLNGALRQSQQQRARLIERERREAALRESEDRYHAERLQLEEQLRHQALHDDLTGLPNRALLRDRLEQLVLAAHRGQTSFALLLMDLDLFKEINDTFGHQYGDLLLQEVGDRLRRTLRESDTVARLGGDEFALLLPSVDEKGAVLTAARALTALAQGFVVEVQSFEVEASVGIVLYPQHGEDATTLLQRADVAMYTAKQAKGWYAVYQPEQDQHTPFRLALMGELRHAIDHDELLLHYQPKVDLKTGQVVGVEALVRWQHPQRGLIPPNEFIPLAERTSLMNPLTTWVVNEALRQCRLWHDAGLEIRVQVNLSARMRDPDLIDTIADLLSAWGVSPQSLGVEITESALMTDPERTMEMLARLHDMGVYICVDDFGTGYSSLAYLQRFPVEEIKIDRSFVKEMVHNASDCSIVQATVSLVRDLGKRSVAEGVEDRETHDLLIQLGCDQAQGYYLSRPLPAAALERWLAEYRAGDAEIKLAGT